MEWAKLLASIPRDASGAIRPINADADPELTPPHRKLLDEIAARNQCERLRDLAKSRAKTER